MNIIRTRNVAYDYVENHGLPIIPICSYDHSNMSEKHSEICSRPGKCPIIKNWQKHRETKKESIDMWLREVPNCNFGLPLGSNSGIVGIDQDGDLGEEILKRLSNNNLPETWMFETPGGGKRWLYSIPEGRVMKKYQESLGDHNECALLGEGQMTVLPPSTHSNGGVYKWIEGHSPGEIKIAEAPDWMTSLMTKNQAPKAQKLEKVLPEQAILKLENKCVRFETDWKLQKQIGLSEEEWFRWTALLTSAGFPEDALLFSQASEKHNSRSKFRLEQLASSSRAAMVRCTTLGCSEKQIQKCFNEKIRTNSKGEITNSPGSMIQQKNLKNKSGYTSDELKKFGFIFDSKTNKPAWINENIFSKHVLQVLDIVYFGPGERFYDFQNGKWSSNDSNSIARKLRRLLHSYVQNFWSEKMEKAYMGALMREAPRVEKLDADRNFINLENGMLNLNTFSMHKHKKEFYSTIRLPIVYNPQAQCPQFLNFLNDVFEKDQERIELVSQIFGYCLTAETKAQKAFIFYGKGANGKSVLIDVLAKLCGLENVSAVTLKELENPFSRFELVDKLLNLSTENEIGSGELNTQYLKAIVSGDPIRVEKKHETGYMYMPVCKLVFGLNNLPYSKDKSFGFQRRLIIIPFNRTFASEEQDVELPEKLEKELPGILNFALKGLKTLRENKFKFIECQAVKEAVETYSEQLNPIRTFVNEMLEAGVPDDRILNQSVKDTFTDWCEDNGINNQYKPATVLTRIKDVLTEKRILFTSGKTTGGRRCLKGVRWTQKKLDLQEEQQSHLLEEEDDIFNLE